MPRKARCCIHNIRIEPDIWVLAIGAIPDIKCHRLLACIPRNRQGVTAIRTGITQAVHFISRDRAVRFDAGLQPDPHGMASPCADEFLFPSHLIDHRTPGGNRQVRCHIFNQDFLFPTESAANPGFDDPDALDGQIQNRAICRRTWKGTCVLVRITRRSSSSQ